MTDCNVIFTKDIITVAVATVCEVNLFIPWQRSYLHTLYTTVHERYAFLLSDLPNYTFRVSRLAFRRSPNKIWYFVYVYVFVFGFLTATEHYNICRSQIYFGVSKDICSFSSRDKKKLFIYTCRRFWKCILSDTEFICTFCFNLLVCCWGFRLKTKMKVYIICPQTAAILYT